MDVVDEDRAAETLALGAMETCEGQDQDILDESKDTEIIEQAVRAAGIKMDPTEAIEIDLTATATDIDLPLSAPPAEIMGMPTTIPMATQDHLYGISVNSNGMLPDHASLNILPAPLSPLEVLSREISAACTSGLYADVTLIGSGSCGGVAAHGMVLAAVSPMLRRVMAESVRAMEEAVTTVMFPDVDEGRLEACLADMYRVMAKVINVQCFILIIVIMFSFFQPPGRLDVSAGDFAHQRGDEGRFGT